MKMWDMNKTEYCKEKEDHKTIRKMGGLVQHNTKQGDPKLRKKKNLTFPLICVP